MYENNVRCIDGHRSSVSNCVYEHYIMLYDYARPTDIKYLYIYNTYTVHTTVSFIYIEGRGCRRKTRVLYIPQGVRGRSSIYILRILRKEMSFSSSPFSM